MAWIKVIEKIQIDGGDWEAKLELCWGNRKGPFNSCKAVVNLEKFKEALKFNSLELLADAFNVSAVSLFMHFDLSPTEELVALLKVLRHFQILRKAEWR